MSNTGECPFVAVVNIGPEFSLDNLFPSNHFLRHPTPDFSLKQIVVHILCKYYEADVCVKLIEYEEHLKNAEAILIYFDGIQSSSWDLVYHWMACASEFDLQLRLLVCPSFCPCADRNRSSAELRRTIVKEEFELIELKPAKDALEEGAEYGITRLKSALEAHLWPNMKIIDSGHRLPTRRREPVSSLTNRPAEQSDAPDVEPEDKMAPPPEANQENFSLDESVKSFELMMKTIVDTRRELANIDFEKRHHLAEKVILQFWNAIGDSDDSSSNSADS